MKKASSPSQPTTVSTFTKQERDDQLAFLYRDDLNNMAKYVTRGRKFGPLSDEELSARYVAVFRNIADNPVDWDSRAIQKDLDAEFQLRNKKIPFDLIKADFDRMSDKLTRHLDSDTRCRRRAAVRGHPASMKSRSIHNGGHRLTCHAPRRGRWVSIER
jgi:hypothetical protein